MIWLKVFRLSWNETKLLAQSILLLLVIHIGLLLIGYSALRGMMEKLLPTKPENKELSDTEIIHRGREIASIVSIAAKHGLFEAGCLRRSLLVWWFLRRDGIQSDLRFGVRKINHIIEAHAWLDYRGVVLNDLPNIHEHYHPLQDIYPSSKLGL